MYRLNLQLANELIVWIRWLIIGRLICSSWGWGVPGPPRHPRWLRHCIQAHLSIIFTLPVLPAANWSRWLNPFLTRVHTRWFVGMKTERMVPSAPDRNGYGYLSDRIILRYFRYGYEYGYFLPVTNTNMVSGFPSDTDNNSDIRWTVLFGYPQDPWDIPHFFLTL